MKTVIYYDRSYEFIDINTSRGKYYRGTFLKYTRNPRSLYDCYKNPSTAKRYAWERLNSVHDFSTVTSYTSSFFTCMCTDNDFNAIFVYTGRHNFMVANESVYLDLKKGVSLWEDTMKE